VSIEPSDLADLRQTERRRHDHDQLLRSIVKPAAVDPPSEQILIYLPRFPLSRRCDAA